MALIGELLNEKTCNSMSSFLKCIHNYSKKVISSQILTSDLINNKIIEEIGNLPGNILISFGKTLCDIKCNIIVDEESKRDHEICLRYKGSQKLVVVHSNLPYSTLEDKEYTSITEVTTIFQEYIKKLQPYFQELENIDQLCKVVEPLKPTFKDNYRRILLDDRIWLHIEVSNDGKARNVHLIRQSEELYDKLHTGLLLWDHDKNIVENIFRIFDLTNIPSSQIKQKEKLDEKAEAATCGICFCVELDDCPGLPQPLCKNPKCEVYFHKACLFQWLVACAGGSLPAFGVANGSCPTCYQPITCSEKDHLL